MEVRGVLYKLRGGYGKRLLTPWQKRYFQLEEGVLAYYENDSITSDDESPRNMLDMKMQPCTIAVAGFIDSAPTQYTLQVIPVDPKIERWKLCASNAEDLNKWIYALKRHEIQATGADESKMSRARDVPQLASSPLPATRAGRSNDNTNTNTPQVSPLSSRRISRRVTTPLDPRARLRMGRISWADTYEALLVLMIMNLCFLFAITDIVRVDLKYMLSFMEIYLPVVVVDLSGDWKSAAKLIFYLLTANLVVARTLFLRARRSLGTSAGSSGGAMSGSSSLFGLPSDGLDRRLSTPVNRSPSVSRSEAASETDGDVLHMMGDSGPGALPEVGEDGKCKIGLTFAETFEQAPACPDHSWSRCDHRHFKVRQKGYDSSVFSSNKPKAPSEAPIYEPLAVDTFITDKRKDHIARFMDLNFPNAAEVKQRLQNAPGLAKFVPPLFVFQLQLPMEAPPMFGSSSEDGPGWAVCVFFKLSDAALEALCRNEPPPGLLCFARWCEKYATDLSWKQRVKLIASCLNLDEMGYSSFVQGFNAKPILIRRTSTIFRDDNNPIMYLELDIHVQKFDAVAQRNIVSMTSRASEMYMEIGIVIESRDEDELPELLVGCVGCNKPKEDMLQTLGVSDELFE